MCGTAQCVCVCVKREWFPSLFRAAPSCTCTCMLMTVSDISFYSPSGLLLDGTSSDVTLTSLAEVSSPSGDIEYSRSMTLANTEYGDSGGYTCQATSPGNPKLHADDDHE